MTKQYARMIIAQLWFIIALIISMSAFISAWIALAFLINSMIWFVHAIWFTDKDER